MDDSWDPDSKAEYMEWIHSGEAAEQQKKACGKLWGIMKKDILVNGPVGLTQCRSVQRRDGETVDVYCLVRNREIVMCFAVHGNHVRLLVMGPYNDDALWEIAEKRTKAW